ncbi:MAG: sensor histidine kinase [Planctomycetota bacterium]|jgi:PAS domain S-box-containing protein
MKGRGERTGGRKDLQQVRKYAARIVATIPVPLIVLDSRLRVVSANQAFYQTFQVAPEQSVGRLLYELGNHQWDIPRLRELLEEILPQRTALHNFEVQHDFETVGRKTMLLNGRKVIEEEEEEELILLAIEDITERKRAKEERAHYTRELARSNADLEQFAYVASHDLQEPLRMVASFCTLLAERYRGKLDADADDFIGFAVEGATRMQALIEGLLQYSRVARRGGGFEPTACEVVLEQATANLETLIVENGAIVTHDPLPTVQADRSQLVQLFQNLIGNAVKFHGEQPPRVHVGAQREEDGWTFFVRDNGIGIEPRFGERVFEIFQRLHERDRYPGTGVGLSICKRIVEHHGGRIWVESQLGKGATFFFTLSRGS